MTPDTCLPGNNDIAGDLERRSNISARARNDDTTVVN